MVRSDIQFSLSILFFLFLLIGFSELGATSLKVGDAAPDFKLQNGKGELFRLSQFRGSLVLLNFWATWCPPCREEIPSMEQLNQRFKARAFNLVTISVDEGWKDIDDFFKEMEARESFLVLLDSERVITSRLYGVEKFPESFLIDQQGIVRKIVIGSTDWMSEKNLREVEQILNSNTSKNQAKDLKTK